MSRTLKFPSSKYLSVKKGARDASMVLFPRYSEENMRMLNVHSGGGSWKVLGSFFLVQGKYFSRTSRFFFLHFFAGYRGKDLHVSRRIVSRCACALR